jgi:hypothetical protein
MATNMLAANQTDRSGSEPFLGIETMRGGYWRGIGLRLSNPCD